MRSLIMAGAVLAILATGTHDAAADAALIASAPPAIVEVPVLNRPIGRDETIQARDIDWVETSANRIPRAAVLDDAGLIGMAAQRFLRAGQVVRARDVALPNLIQKGELVSIVFSTPNMILSARGRALEDAPEGHSLRVVNAHSNRTIEATAVAPGVVAAMPVDHARIMEALK